MLGIPVPDTEFAAIYAAVTGWAAFVALVVVSWGLEDRSGVGAYFDFSFAALLAASACSRT